MESDHMTARTITVAGARGGSGTTTVAAATALVLAGHAATELVAAERDTTAALVGLTGPHDGCAPIKVAEAAHIGLDAVWDG
jgi:CO dehydrogenase nickel-insertion accessory protein CooC1